MTKSQKPPTSKPFAPVHVQPSVLAPEEQEAVVVAELLDGASPAQAGRVAGLSEPGAGLEVSRRPHVRSALVAALEARGLGEQRIVQVIDEGLGAQTPARVYKDGSVAPGGADHPVRHKYLTTLLELRGDLERGAQDSGDTWEAMILAVRARRAGRGAP